MKQLTTLGLSFALAIGCTAAAAAQTTATPTTSSTAGNLTTATPSATGSGTAVKRKPPTTATPDMINEAIQRSEARAARETATGRAQQWGSEEPFTYNPAVKKFDATKQ